MSGQIGNNILRVSGVIAATAAGLNWVSTVVTASTLTAEAGNGYFINTTSNTCTITLPSSAEAGDQIVLMDYLRTWGTNKIIIDSNGLNYQGDPDTFTVEYDTNGETLNIVYSGATQGWIPLDDDVVADVPVRPPTQKGIFVYGQTHSISNLVSSSGVVASDTAGIAGGARDAAASEYGGDKGIIAFGKAGGGPGNVSNLITNAGVVGADVTGVGTARSNIAACAFGGDKCIFAYGETASPVNVSNLVSNAGVVATDSTGVGTARYITYGTEYGVDKGIFAYGFDGSRLSMSNKVSNTGVVATDTGGVGTARNGPGACGYGTDTAIFAYGHSGSALLSVSNKVSNTGVVASDVSGVGTVRVYPGATEYGGDKGIFAYGNVSSSGPASGTAISNLVSNSGVIASDTAGVGTARWMPSSCGYSITA